VRRSARLLVGIPLLAGGVVVGVYGLFALLYNGDCTNCYVYVTLFGRQWNANHVGWVALAIALAVLVGGAFLLRPRGSRGASR
jgi:hypothetical protein